MILGPGGQHALCVCVCARTRARAGRGCNEREPVFPTPALGTPQPVRLPVSLPLSLPASVCRSVSFPSLVSLQPPAAAELIGEREKVTPDHFFLHHFPKLERCLNVCLYARVCARTRVTRSKFFYVCELWKIPVFLLKTFPGISLGDAFTCQKKPKEKCRCLF